MKLFFRKLRPIFDTHHFTSRTVLVFSRLLFFFLYSPVLFFSAKLSLTENSSFFAFPPFFQKWFHAMSSVFIVAMSQNDQCELNVQESSDGDQNNEKRVQFVMSDETELLFSITKRIEKARHSSKILYGKSDSIIIAMVTSED